jgi:hypothetical protein
MLAKPYVIEGLKYEYKIIIKETNTEWCKNAEILFQKNQHGVPLEAIKSMLNRWEDNFTVEEILKSQPPKHKKKN